MDYKKRAYIIIGATVVFATVILLLFLFKTTKLSINLPIDTHLFADYGVLVGGIATAILTILNIFLLIQTLNDQRDNFNTLQSNFKIEQQEQKRNFDRGQIESRFFELLKIHRENSNDITIKDRVGKKIFLSLQREFYQSLEIVNAAASLRTDKLAESEVINISYLCFFFGAVGVNSERTIKENLKHYSDAKNPDFVSNLITLFTQAQPRIKSDEKFDYNPFEGHQSRLGHYFRQLFQLVKYIDDQPKELLTYFDKYQYIKTLRAQLSTQEQTLLFFNSLSDLGKPWEKEVGLDENKKLITKYNLIKNIPTGYIDNINIKTYYSQVHYEGDGKKTTDRQQLEANYN
jgi:hypothetical protein